MALDLRNDNTLLYLLKRMRAEGATGPPFLGAFAFFVDERGHLMLSYAGKEAPDFHIDGESGHLLLRLPE